MTEWFVLNGVSLINITMIDLVLAGDNAIIVGLAASRVAPEIRAKVIFWGIAAAVVLRIVFAAITVQLLAVIGLTLAGGILLLWVCWKMYRQVRETRAADHRATAEPECWRKRLPAKRTSSTEALTRIVLADVS